MSRHRRRVRAEALASEGELNLVPYLDVMVNLVLFLLVTYTVSLNLNGIPFSPPGAGSGGAPQLTLAISKAGYTLIASGARATIPLALDGEHDDTALSAHLARIKRDVAGLSEVLVIVAEPDTTTEDLVQAMDAAREAPHPDDPSRTVPLFSKVSFASPGAP